METLGGGDIARILREALPDEADWVGNETLSEIAGDPTAEFVNLEEGPNSGFLEAVKLLTTAVSLLMKARDWLRSRDDRRRAMELFPAFCTEALSPMELAVLPDGIRRQLFKLLLEQQKLLEGAVA